MHVYIVFLSKVLLESMLLRTVDTQLELFFLKHQLKNTKLAEAVA